MRIGWGYTVTLLRHSPKRPCCYPVPAMLTLRWFFPTLALVIIGVIGWSVWLRVKPSSEPVIQERLSEVLYADLVRETGSAFLVTGNVVLQTRYTARNEALFLPGVLGIPLGTNEVSIRLPGTVHYGVDMRQFTPNHIDVREEEREIHITLPNISVLSTEPDLSRLDVQTQRGWMRSRQSAELLREEAIRAITDRFRAQGDAYLTSGSLIPRSHTEDAFRVMLAPFLDATGLADARIVFNYGVPIVSAE